VVSFFLFVAAMLSKAAPVTLPVVLLILDVYPLRRLGDGPGRWFGSSARRALLEKLPFVAVSLVFVGLAIAAKPPELVFARRFDASARFAQACYATWFYISKTMLPLDLNAFYPSPVEISWLAPPFQLSILGTLAVTAGLFLLRRRWPGLLVTWLIYLVFWRRVRASSASTSKSPRIGIVTSPCCAGWSWRPPVFAGSVGRLRGRALVPSGLSRFASERSWSP
jgi:hypothetical protein